MPQALGVTLAGPLEEAVEGLPLVDRGSTAAPGDVDAGPLGELFQCLAELDLFHPHQEAEDIPADAADPTAVGLALWADLKARFRVVVPRAEADQRLPLTPQSDEGGDKIRDVGGVANPLLDVVSAERTSNTTQNATLRLARTGTGLALGAAGLVSTDRPCRTAIDAGWRWLGGIETAIVTRHRHAPLIRALRPRASDPW